MNQVALPETKGGLAGVCARTEAAVASRAWQHKPNRPTCHIKVLYCTVQRDELHCLGVDVSFSRRARNGDREIKWKTEKTSQAQWHRYMSYEKVIPWPRRCQQQVDSGGDPSIYTRHGLLIAPSTPWIRLGRSCMAIDEQPDHGNLAIFFCVSKASQLRTRKGHTPPPVLSHVIRSKEPIRPCELKEHLFRRGYVVPLYTLHAESVKAPNEKRGRALNLGAWSLRRRPTLFAVTDFVRGSYVTCASSRERLCLHTHTHQAWPPLSSVPMADCARSKHPPPLAGVPGRSASYRAAAAAACTVTRFSPCCADLE